MVDGTELQELEKLSPSTLNVNKECKPQAEGNSSNTKGWQLILEPALVGAMIAINLGQTSLQNFYLRTACTVDLGKSPEICSNGVGEEFRAAEVASQVVVSSVNVSRSFVGSLISTIVLLFVGPWSDCSGRRKPLLILPLLGMCVMTTGLLLMLTFPGASTLQVLYTVQIPISLGGNFGLLLAAAFSHIGDVCHATGRDVTRTMGTHRAAVQIAHVIGSIGGPLLYRKLGFYGVFPLVLVLQIASLIYVVLKIRDVNVNTENQVSVFNWRLPFNAIQCLVRKREGNRRMIILLMLIVALGDRMLLSAEVLLAYMYYRYKFHWDDILFGSFLAYRNVVSFAGTLLILTILKRRLRFSDEMVGTVSCISYVLATSGLFAAKSTIVVFILPIIGIISQGSQVVQRPIINKQILPNEQGTLLILTILKRRLRFSDEMVGTVSCISYVLATSGLFAAKSTIVVFILPIIGIISQGSQVVQRPIINKQILPNEQGKIYSVLGALESATQTISSPLYSLLYSTTVPVLPDAWLLPGISLAIIQLFSYLCSRQLRLRRHKHAPDKDAEITSDKQNERDIKETKEIDSR